MFITGLGTALPPNCYSQSECWTALQSSGSFQKLTSRSQAILKKVLLGKNGIATRHLAINPLQEVLDVSPDALHRRFATHAPALATQAARKALHAAGSRAADMDAVIVSTCTGYLCPGLTSYVSERLGLRPDVLALDLVGQGCGAALPNLATGHALLASGHCRKALSICVEVCSAAFYLDDDPGVLISACLFGDGAGAAVLSHEPPQNGRSVRWKHFATALSPARRDLLRFEQRGGLLRNILTAQVPGLAAEHAGNTLKTALRAHGIKKEDIAAWIFHAGGRDVLLALKARLELSEADLCWSGGILETCGNLSSPFVYFVLYAALNGGAPDGLWWMASFGAGFSSHGALLSVS